MIILFVKMFWNIENFLTMPYVSRSASDPNLHKRRSRKVESSLFKTLKVKKLQKYCKIYKTFEIFATWYFCFQKYCLILKTFDLFRMWTALPVIPTYTRGGRGERGGSELHNSVWYSCTILQYRKLFNYSPCELLL